VNIDPFQFDETLIPKDHLAQWFHESELPMAKWRGWKKLETVIPRLDNVLMVRPKEETK
jgi:hypothetical protein